MEDHERAAIQRVIDALGYHQSLDEEVFRQMVDDARLVLVCLVSLDEVRERDSDGTSDSSPHA